VQYSIFETGGGHALTMTLLVEESTRVQVTLSRATPHGWLALWSEEYPAELFHIPLHLRGTIADSAFALPDHLRGQLRDSLGPGGTTEPLWIQLVEPFGYLGLVSWADLLHDVARGPVLRLPTLSLEPRRPSDSLQVALLAAVPYEHRSSPARQRLHGRRVTVAKAGPPLRKAARPATKVADAEAESSNNREPLKATHVDSLVRAILEGSPRKVTTVHVVTTPWIYDDLRSLWRGRRAPGDAVTLHNPWSLAGKLDRSPLPATHNFWLRMLALAQRGEQADVVHLVAHGSVVQTKTRLVFADSLKSRAPDLATRYVSSKGLQSALDMLGAWSVCLSSPPRSTRVPQLRYFAARLVEERPGPLLFTDLQADPTCADVRRGYGFLYSPQPADPPRLEHALLSCEPYRVRGFPEHAGGLTRVVPAPQPLPTVRELLSRDTTPAWVAGVQRFIERQQVEIARLERDAPVGSATPEAQFHTLGVRDAVAMLQEAIAAHAGETGGRS